MRYSARTSDASRMVSPAVMSCWRTRFARRDSRLPPASTNIRAVSGTVGGWKGQAAMMGPDPKM